MTFIVTNNACQSCPKLDKAHVRPVARLKQLGGGGGGGQANWLNKATPLPHSRHSKKQTDKGV